MKYPRLPICSPRLGSTPKTALWPSALGILALALGGCALIDSKAPAPAAAVVAQPAVAPAAAASAPPLAAAARPTPSPAAPPPFETVTKDATSSAGLLPVWTKDEKTWIEVPTAQLDRPLFLGVSMASGLAQGFILPGLMGKEHVVTLRRVGNTVQLLARNTGVSAPVGTPLARALRESYSDSLLAVAPLASAPHPQSKSLLVDANVLFGTDIAGIQTQLEAVFRLPYALDRANSSIESARTTAQHTAVTMRTHYAVPKMPAPRIAIPGAPPASPASLPNPPSAVPDARSFFIDWAYTLAALPETAMRARQADPRVGYFVDSVMDFGDDTQGEKRSHLITRWRLEKKDPAQALSDVKQPVRVVMDRNIPEKWRPAVQAGILEWNLAFERAGLRGALVVEQQAADADWTAFEGTRLLAVRWFAMEGPGATAVGPSQSDPRTGEILRGAAIIPENWVRFGRNYLQDRQPALPEGADSLNGTLAAPGSFAQRLLSCTYAHDALEQTHFAMELLNARGDLPGTGPAADRFVADSLKEVVMHEVGHALGLRHNFKASAGITQAQLADRSFTEKRGTTNSVMDYTPVNLPLQNEPTPQYRMTTLGAYDYWAIDYGYRDIAPEQEGQTLAALARQSETNSAFLYGTDEDAAAGDPLANRFDLGSDPMAYATRQLQLSRELWSRTEKRELGPDDDLTIYRRNLSRVFSGLRQSTGLLIGHVGGVNTSRSLNSASLALYAPVETPRQRQALQLVLAEVFSSSSFRFDPKVISRLGFDHVGRLSRGEFTAQTDFSLPDAVLQVQRPALDALMGDSLAARIANAEPKVADPSLLLSYAEIQQSLSQSVWSELKAGGRTRDIDSLRRNLQREHLRRLGTGLLRATSSAAADVRAVHRATALALDADLKRALAQTGWSAMARAHLADSQATLAEALKAPLAKQGV